MIGARRLIVQRIGGGALADIGEQAGGGADGGSQALGERIDQRIGSRGNTAGAPGSATDGVIASGRELAIGEAGLIRGADAEAGISVAGGGIGLVENAYATANHGLLSQPVSEAETRRAGGEIGIVLALREAVHAGKPPDTHERGGRTGIRVEVARGGEVSARVGVVGGLIGIPNRENLVAQRVLDADIELRALAVVTFQVSHLDLVAGAEAQGQAVGDFPIVLQITGIVGTAEIGGGVVIDVAAGGHAEQQGGDAHEAIDTAVGGGGVVGGLLGESAAESEGAIRVTRGDVAAGFIVVLEAEVQAVLALRHGHAGRQDPAVVGRPTEAAAAEERAGEAADVDVGNGGAAHRRRVNHVGHPDGLRSDNLRGGGVAGGQLGEAEIAGLQVENGGGRNHVSPIGAEAGKGAVVIRVAGGDGRRERGGGAELIAVELAEQGVEFVLVAEGVVPADDGLVVPVAAGIGGIEIVGGEARGALAGRIRRRQVGENARGHRADAALRNHIAGEGISPVRRAGAAAARFRGHAAAGARGQRIEDAHAVLGEVLAVAHIERNRVLPGAGEGDDFLPAFIADEDKVLVLTDGSAEDAAELVLLVVAFGGAGHIVAEVVGIQFGVAKVIVDVAVPVVAAPLDHGVDHAAGLVAVLRVVHGGHGAEFLNRIHAGGEIPLAASIADRGPVHHEDVVAVALARAIEFVTAVDVPSAGSGEARGAELLLAEDHARCQIEEHVTLPAVQRVLLSFDRVEHQALIGVAGIDDVLLADDGDFLVHLADDQTDGQIHLLAHGEGDRLALQGLETGGNNLDGVVAGLQ